MKLFAAIFTVVVCLGPVFAQQQADPEFDTSVAKPAYKKDGPRVMFDEAHHNFHTSDGRYKPFVDLLMNDGYNVIRNRQPFVKTRLSGFKILVIANALGAEEDDDIGADSSAFTEEEITAVADWVKDGGALLLIADHAPFGGAASALSKRFGVTMGVGYTLHPITEGRAENERLKLVRSFTGQALKGPEGSVAILKLSDSAYDSPSFNSGLSVSVAGWAQAVALKFGKGRVLVQGEAAMLSAQISGPDKHTMGMNVPGNDDRQYVLNVMHWLSGVLREK